MILILLGFIIGTVWGASATLTIVNYLKKHNQFKSN